MTATTGRHTTECCTHLEIILQMSTPDEQAMEQVREALSQPMEQFLSDDLDVELDAAIIAEWEDIQRQWRDFLEREAMAPLKPSMSSSKQ